MTPDEIRKDGERGKKFVVGFAWISIAVIVALWFAASHHLTWDDLLNYGMILPLTVLWEAVHSPYFWIVSAIIWVNVMIGSLHRAWRTHCNQQQRIIELLEEIDRNELARYSRLSEKIEHCARTLAAEYRERA
jgi:hypothetical protein